MKFSLQPATQHRPLFMHILSKPVAVLLSIHREVQGLLHTNQPEELIKKSGFWWLLPWILIQWTREATGLGTTAIND